MQVTLGKTLDRAVRFAYWCRKYQAPPLLVAEAMELYRILSNKRMGWEKSQEHRSLIRDRLEHCGFTHVEFQAGDRLSFNYEKTGDTNIKLPEL